MDAARCYGLHPIGGAAESARGRARADAADTSTEDSALANVRVLVVEDDHDAAEFVKNLLAMHGAEVLMAASAPEALARLADARPDILVSDIGLRRWMVPADSNVSDTSHSLRAARSRRSRSPRSRERKIGRARFAPAIRRTWRNPSRRPELVATIASFAELSAPGERTRPANRRDLLEAATMGP